jgi:site-specific recombinase XerD
MKYTVRPAFLTHKANEEGYGTIRIALTINRVVTYHATTYRIHKSQWDAKKRLVVNHENASIINVDLRREVAKIEKQIVENKLQNIPVTHKIIKEGNVKDRSFFSYAQEVRKSNKEANRLKTFCGNSLLLSEVDTAFLRRYEAHERARGMAQNTINQSFKYIRRITNQALAEGLIKESPFKGFLMPKYIQSERIYLVESELKRLVKLLDADLPENLYNTLSFFLLGAYSGLRHSDWVLFDYDKRVEGEFLKLRPRKTSGSSGKWVVLPIGPTLRKILRVVRTLPPPVSNQKCNTMLKAITGLAKIHKPLTTHVARHSFGYICASNGLPKSVTAELLGVNSSTVEVYYHLSGENIKKQAAILKTI